MAGKILLSVGENSGDLHASHLIRELKTLRPDLEIFASGGDRMAASGAALVAHIRDFSAAGVVEVLGSLPAIRRAMNSMKVCLREQKPDVLVCVDFPDFNFRLAAYARKLGVPVVYYISPQVWAWRAGRVETLKKLVRKMLVIFEFEKAIYENAGVPVAFVGHPLMDALNGNIPTRSEARARRHVPENALALGLLPGSRRKEFQKLYPVMAQTADRLKERFPGLVTLVSVAETLDPQWCRSMDGARGDRIWVDNHSIDVMAAADFCVVASGTATLETAIVGTPMAVVYKVNPLSFALLRQMVRVNHICIVNILAGEEVVPERLQDEANPIDLANLAESYLADSGLRNAMKKKLSAVREKMGAPGAARRAAEEILSLLR